MQRCQFKDLREGQATKMAEKPSISPGEKRRIQEMVAKSGEEYAPHNYIIKPHVVPQHGCYKSYCTRCRKYGHLHHQCSFVLRRQSPATSQASKTQKKSDSPLTVSPLKKKPSFPQAACPELQANEYVPRQKIVSKFSISYKPIQIKLAEQVKDNSPSPSTSVLGNKQKSTNQNRQTAQKMADSTVTQVRSNSYPTDLTTEQPLAAAAKTIASPSTIARADNSNQQMLDVACTTSAADKRHFYPGSSTRAFYPGNFPLQSPKTADKPPEIPLTQDNTAPPQTHYGYYTSDVGFTDYRSPQLYHQDPHVYYDQPTWPQGRYSTFADAYGRQGQPGFKWHGYEESGYPHGQNFYWHRPPRESFPQDRDYQSQRDWEWRHGDGKYRHQQEQSRRNDEACSRYNEMHKRYYTESGHPETDPRNREEPRFQGMKYRHHDEEIGSHDYKPREHDQESNRHDEPRSDQERCYDKGRKGYEEGSYRRYREGRCMEDIYDQQGRKDYYTSGQQEDRLGDERGLPKWNRH